MKVVAMIPARLGSQRLKQKNLRTIGGIPLVVRAIRKCKDVGAFSEVWVNTEADEIGQYAKQEDVGYHKRPTALANHVATSEQFVYEFLQQHECDYVVQVHSIAPLLSGAEITAFVNALEQESPDVMLSVINENLECLFQGAPVNFTYAKKENSQDLAPVQKVCWSITAWKRSTFMRVHEEGETATFAGRVSVFPVSRLAGHVIKTEEDLVMAKAVLGDV